MNLLGVVNPPEDYSLGYDLLGPVERQYTVLSDWNDMAIVVPEFKAEFTLQSLGIGGPDVTTKTDAPIDNAESLLESRRPQLVAVMKDMTKFGK